MEPGFPDRLIVPRRRMPLASRATTTLLGALALAGACGRSDTAATTDTAATIRGDSTESYTDPAAPIRARAGEEFAIVLDADGTTGYEWRLADSLPPAVVRVVGNRYEAPGSAGQTNRAAVGGVGHERWTFRATSAGDATITLVYGRPLERSAATDTARFRLAVQ